MPPARESTPHEQHQNLWKLQEKNIFNTQPGFLFVVVVLFYLFF